MLENRPWEDDKIAEGRISRQSVPGGRKIEQSETVSIVVSKGKRRELPPAPVES